MAGTWYPTCPKEACAAAQAAHRRGTDLALKNMAGTWFRTCPIKAGSGGAPEVLDVALRLAVDLLQAFGVGRRPGARRRPTADEQREQPHASASGSTSAKSVDAASCNGPGPTSGAAARARSSSARSRRRW